MRYITTKYYKINISCWQRQQMPFLHVPYTLQKKHFLCGVTVGFEGNDLPRLLAEKFGIILTEQQNIYQNQYQRSKLQEQNVIYEQEIRTCKEMKPKIKQKINLVNQTIYGINEKIKKQIQQIQLQQQRHQLNTQLSHLQQKYAELKQNQQMIRKTIQKDLDIAKKVDSEQITVNTIHLQLLIQQLNQKKTKFNQLFELEKSKKQRINRDIKYFQEEKYWETIRNRENNDKPKQQKQLLKQFKKNIIYQQRQVIQQIKRKATFQQQWERVEPVVLLLFVLSIITFCLK